MYQLYFSFVYSRCDIEGNTALHNAVCHFTTTRLLLSYVDNFDVVNYEHNTPLLLAVCSGSKEREQTIRLLINSGADVNKENAYGEKIMVITHVLLLLQT